MALNSSASFLFSSVMSVLIFSGMQFGKSWLASSETHTIIGGLMGSLLFVFILTAVGNLETIMFNKSFQMKLFPEVFMCLLSAIIASGLVHRVCMTLCLLFSTLQLYYIHQISQEKHSIPEATVTRQSKKRN